MPRFFFLLLFTTYMTTGCRLIPLKAKPAEHPDLEVEKKVGKKKDGSKFSEEEQLRLRQLEGTDSNT